MPSVTSRGLPLFGISNVNATFPIMQLFIGFRLSEQFGVHQVVINLLNVFVIQSSFRKKV